MDLVVPQYNDVLGVLLGHMVSSRAHLVTPCQPKAPAKVSQVCDLQHACPQHAIQQPNYQP